MKHQLKIMNIIKPHANFQQSDWTNGRVTHMSHTIITRTTYVSDHITLEFVVWNFGLHVDITLSVIFTVQKFQNHGVCNKIARAMAPIKPEISRLSYGKWNKQSV